MHTHMNKSSLVVALALAALSGCGSKDKGDDALSFMTNHAVGTYIGGGSIAGSDCTYAGPAGMFEARDGKAATDPDRGPRFAMTTGTITKDCKGTKTSITVHTPTGAKITGPTTAKAGGESDLLQGYLVTNGKQLGGEGYLDWQLGPDCSGIAEFAPVMGAQDTGGKDRSRKLVAKAKGTCTVTLAIQTGNESHQAFKGETFKAEHKVAIQ